MKVCFSVPPSSKALTAALTGVSNLNYVLLGRRDYPPLLESGIRYVREQRGIGEPEAWQNVEELYESGEGDCEDLVNTMVAQLRRRGIAARSIAVPSGGKKFHSLVRLPDGTTFDPSRVLGM